MFDVLSAGHFIFVNYIYGLNVYYIMLIKYIYILISLVFMTVGVASFDLQSFPEYAARQNYSWQEYNFVNPYINYLLKDGVVTDIPLREKINPLGARLLSDFGDDFVRLAFNEDFNLCTNAVNEYCLGFPTLVAEHHYCQSDLSRAGVGFCSI